jgi:mannose-6-phosphate isomerase-like protein (cupin superfamily)
MNLTGIPLRSIPAGYPQRSAAAQENVSVFIAEKSLNPIDFGGLRIFDYTAGHNLSSSLAVIDVPSGVHHPEAWSKRSDKYYLVISGAILFVLEGVQTELRAGDVCVVPRGSRFSYSNPSTTPARLVLVHTPSFELDSEVFVEPTR